MAIEVVFPVHAIWRLSDDWVQKNEAVLCCLESGDADRDGKVLILYSGSRAEGLALEDGWGHPEADLDIMYILGDELSVSQPYSHDLGSDQSKGNGSSSLPSTPLLQMGPYHPKNGNSCLEYDPRDCPPAYTRLRVTEPSALKKHPLVREQGMEEFGGHHWLLPMVLNGIFQRILNLICKPDDRATCIHGPAGELYGGLIDRVPCLQATGPHPAINVYLQRIRNGWPSKKQLAKQQKIPMCLAMTGHKTSHNRHQLARMSWSLGELRLISQLPDRIKQGYIAAKYTLKSFLKYHRKTNDGRSHVGSFHLKNTLLNYLEQTPPSQISSPYNLMLDLLHKLLSYLKDRQLPLYFLPECNLLETVGLRERQIARRAIRAIIDDPVAAIINCPEIHLDIYGDIPHKTLLATLHEVFAEPRREKSKESLFRLLSHLDKWRQRQYREQLRLDKRDGVSGRPELKGLVKMLRQVK